METATNAETNNGWLDKEKEGEWFREKEKANKIIKKGKKHFILK